MKGCGYPMTIRMNITFLWEEDMKMMKKPLSGFVIETGHYRLQEMQESKGWSICL